MIGQTDYQRRRRQFMQKMEGGAAILYGASIAYHQPDLACPFRQDSDFLYLTGFEEPGAICLLLPEHPEHRFVLFVPPRDPKAERWDGPRAGVEGAVERFGADAAHPLDRFQELLPGYLNGVSTVYGPLGHRESLDLQLLSIVRTGASRGYSISRLLDARLILNEMRCQKSRQEIELLRTTGRITAEAHREAMRAVRPGLAEHEIKAVLDHGFSSRGATRHAFEPIVASGPAATILHYARYDGLLQEGHLIVIDAGAEFEHYVSDLTRTVPVSGRFSEPQKAAYRAVLEAQKNALSRVRPGVRLREVHQAAVDVIARQLNLLGVLREPPEEILESGSYERFFMHRTSHAIGLDLRDPLPQGKDEQILLPGMTVTVEPGLYFPADSEAPEAFLGMGIRIEDSVLVTDEGCEILTHAAPKEIEQVEAPSQS